jgi:hypothetical protein
MVDDKIQETDSLPELFPKLPELFPKRKDGLSTSVARETRDQIRNILSARNKGKQVINQAGLLREWITKCADEEHAQLRRNLNGQTGQIE